MLSLNKGGERHLLTWETTPLINPANDLTQPSFQRFIRNRNVRARFEPQNVNSYLLISPGYDGRYGTADDITNFKPNGS
jgi:hypothetical protein